MHVVGYTFVHGKRRLDFTSSETDGTVRGKRRRQMVEDEEVDGPTEAEYMELQRARTLRVAQLARDAAAGCGPWSPDAKSSLPRTRRLGLGSGPGLGLGLGLGWTMARRRSRYQH